MTRASLLACLAVAALAAGCGHEQAAPSDEAQVAETINAWNAAYASNDAETLCGLMTAEAAEGMKDPYNASKLTGEKTGAPYGDTCEEAVRNNPPPEKYTQVPPPLSEKAVTVDGELAVIESHQGWCTPFQEVDGKWLIAGLPLPPGDPPYEPCLPSDFR